MNILLNSVAFKPSYKIIWTYGNIANAVFSVSIADGSSIFLCTSDTVSDGHHKHTVICFGK